MMRLVSSVRSAAALVAVLLPAAVLPAASCDGSDSTPPAKVVVHVLFPEGTNPMVGATRVVFTFNKPNVDTFVETVPTDIGTMAELSFTYTFPDEMATTVLEVSAEDGSGAVRARGRSMPFDLIRGLMLDVGVLVLQPGVWSYAPATTRLAMARAMHGAVATGDGGLLVAGGTTLGGVTPSVEVFDLNAWERVAGIPDMPAPRSRFATLALNADQTLLVGGVMASGTADLFDGPTQSWSVVGLPPELPDTWKAPRVVDLNDGTGIFLGGFDGSDVPVGLIVRGTLTGFNVLSGTTTRVQPAVTPVTTPDGPRLLLFGGNLGGEASASLLDPATGTVEDEVNAPADVRYFTSVATVSGNRVIVVGGVGPDGTTLLTNALLFDADCLDVLAGCASVWSDMGPVLSSSGGFADAVGVPIDPEGDDPRALFIGGVDGSENPVPNSIMVNAETGIGIRFPMRTPRASAAILQLPTGQIAAIGGLDGTGTPLDSIEVFEPPAR
jgi:hypothetical protein